MNKLGLQGSVTDKDFIIHILNNFPKDYNVILDGLKNCLTVTGDYALTIIVIHKKFNHRYEKIKNKKIGKSRKRKSFWHVQ